LEIVGSVLFIGLDQTKRKEKKRNRKRMQNQIKGLDRNQIITNRIEEEEEEKELRC